MGFPLEVGYDIKGRHFIMAGLAAMVLGISSCYGLSYITYSEGTRVGVVNKLSEHSFPCKAYAGQMALEGVVGAGSSTAANVWEFSLDNWGARGENKEDLVEKLHEAIDTGKRVKVTYVAILGMFPCRSDNQYLIQSVEFTEQK